MKIQFKICYKEEFDRCKIHHLDKICLNLATFDEFEAAVLQTVLGDVCHRVITFLNPLLKPTVREMA